MSNLVATPSRLSFAPVKNAQGKIVNERKIRTFLWDNPEMRRAFREAKDKEMQRKNERTQR